MQWIERQRNFLEFTLSSLLRRKWKNGALLLVYTLIVFVVSSVIFFANGLRKDAEALLKDSPEMVVQRIIAGRHDLIPMSYTEIIKDIKGVRSVKRRLWGYYYHPASRTNYTVMVPDDFAYQDDEVVVGSCVLGSWGSLQDNQLYFRTYDGGLKILKPVKSLGPSTDIVSCDLILMSEPTFRSLFGIPENFATDLAVGVRNQLECPVIAEKIYETLPDTRTILREEILRTYSSLFDWRSGYVIVLLSGAVLAFFIFAWDKATGLSGEEKTEIGVLKALGWDTSDILMMKSWEGTVISLTAFLLGVVLAYVHVFFASATLFEHALKGWSTLYPSLELNPSVNAYQLAVLFFLTVLPYTFITIVPAWRVSVTDPDAIMKEAL